MASRYLTKTGLEWLADLNERNWRNANGSVCVTRIAKDAGFHRSHLHRCINLNSGAGQKIVDALVDLAESAGVDRHVAEEELFVRPTTPKVKAGVS